MVDDQQAEITPEGKPEAPMPSANETASDTEVQPLGEEQSPATTGEEPMETKLPEEAPERTKREFDRLREKLKQERERREQAENYYKTLAQPKEVPPPPIVDPNTGLLNEQALSDLQRRTIQAERDARIAKEQAQQQALEQEEREMFSSFPELDPAGKSFDESFSHHVAAIKLHSMLNPQAYGKQLSGKQAAEYVRKFVPASKLETAKSEGAKEAIEKLTPKEQAALEATGTPGRRVQTQSIDDLRRRTRRGDLNAFAERLKSFEKSQG